MNKAFNLLDEPWLPVRLRNGQVKDMGLLEVFTCAGEISALAETAPPSLIAQYRLLLAITHRALTLAFDTWKDKDRARWYREGLPVEALKIYLEKHRERFWLFHPEFPFMQVAALATAAETRDKLKPWTQISLDSATYGDGPTVFDHTVNDLVEPERPGICLRKLLGFLQYVLPGTIRVLRHSDISGPLTNSAAVIPLGASLSQTLCLSLHLPPSSRDMDLPCWEKPCPSVQDLGRDVLPTGPNDLYTRLTRAVLFRNGGGGFIRHLHFAAGVGVKDDPSVTDPMICYRAGAEKLIPLTFREGRAFWRDLPALVPCCDSNDAHPAATLNFTENLLSLLPEKQGDQVILVAGLASNRAKLERWRIDQVVLPVGLITSIENASEVRRLIRISEQGFDGLKKISIDMITDALPDAKSRDAPARAKKVFNSDSGPATATYFSYAERSLGAVLTLLAEDRVDEAEQLWRQALAKAARASWQVICTSMGQSVAALRAEARHSRHFHALLRELQPEHADAQPVKEA